MAHPNQRNEEDPRLAPLLARFVNTGFAAIIGVGKGWYGLLYDLNEKLSQLDNLYSIHQIKEKFGLLRIYIQPSKLDEKESVLELMYAAVAEAESKSASICEYCGEAGRRCIMNTWILTLCDDCMEARRIERNLTPEQVKRDGPSSKDFVSPVDALVDFYKHEKE